MQNIQECNVTVDVKLAVRYRPIITNAVLNFKLTDILNTDSYFYLISSQTGVWQ